MLPVLSIFSKTSLLTVLVSKGKKSVRKKIKEDRVSPRTYNNNIKFARALFSWAIEKSYARINPFEHLKQKKAQGKDRTIIPKEVRDRIVAYFREKNPAFIIVMQLVYKSFLRPVEITRVKVEQLNFEKHCIEMKGSQKKNGKDHNCRMDEQLEALLRDHIRGAKPDDFVFGAGTWKPSQTPAASHLDSKQQTPHTSFVYYSSLNILSASGTYHVRTSSAVGVCPPGKWNERL